MMTLGHANVVYTFWKPGCRGLRFGLELKICLIAPLEYDCRDLKTDRLQYLIYDSDPSKK